MKRLIKILFIFTIIFTFATCSTWRKLDNTERGAVIGGGSGAVLGGAVGGTGGAVLGGAGGAVAGGLIGHAEDEHDHGRRR